MRSPFVNSFQFPRALFSRFCGGLLREREKFTTLSFNVFMHMEKESFKIFKLSKTPRACCLHSPPCLTAQFQWNLYCKYNSKEAAKLILTSFSFFSISACSFSQAATRTSLNSSHTTYPSVLGRRTQSVSYERKKKGSKCLLTQPKSYRILAELSQRIKVCNWSQAPLNTRYTTSPGHQHLTGATKQFLHTLGVSNLHENQIQWWLEHSQCPTSVPLCSGLEVSAARSQQVTWMARRDRHFHIHSEEPVMTRLKRDGDNPAFWREVKNTCCNSGTLPSWPATFHSSIQLIFTWQGTSLDFSCMVIS